VLRMKEVNERRTERRLQYRWHIRFVRNTKEKPLPGQIYDISSKGMALLCRAGKNCPHPDQLITTNFGVPYFNTHDSFDTVFFNRAGRVCRVDHLSSQVHRVAIQFAEPLFFNPGEQNIDESEAQKRLESKAQLIIKTKEKTTAYGEALARAEEKTKAEARARAIAEAKAKTEAKLRAKAEKKAGTAIEKKAKAEAEARKKVKSYAEEIAKVKSKVAQETVRIKAETTDTIAKVKAELKTKTKVHTRPKVQDKENTKYKARQSTKKDLLEKVDKYITDRNRIYPPFPLVPLLLL